MTHRWVIFTAGSRAHCIRGAAPDPFHEGSTPPPDSRHTVVTFCGTHFHKTLGAVSTEEKCQNCLREILWEAEQEE